MADDATTGKDRTKLPEVETLSDGEELRDAINWQMPSPDEVDELAEPADRGNPSDSGDENSPRVANVEDGAIREADESGSGQRNANTDDGENETPDAGVNSDAVPESATDLIEEFDVATNDPIQAGHQDASPEIGASADSTAAREGSAEAPGVDTSVGNSDDQVVDSGGDGQSNGDQPAGDGDNGHGNDADGFDESNPGQGGGQGGAQGGGQTADTVEDDNEQGNDADGLDESDPDSWVDVAQGAEQDSSDGADSWLDLVDDKPGGKGGGGKPDKEDIDGNIEGDLAGGNPDNGLLEVDDFIV